MTEHDLSAADRERLTDFAFDLCEKYGLPFTNNEPRVQDGRQLRHIGDLVRDLADMLAAEQKARDEAVASMEALVEALPELTEGPLRVGTNLWPECDRDAYSLAIEEAQAAIRAALADDGALARIRAEAWPCANYTAPVTCLHAGTTPCDWCREAAQAIRTAFADADTTAHDRPLGSDAPSAHGGVASSPHGESPQGDHSPVAGTPTAHDRAAAVRQGGEQ